MGKAADVKAALRQTREQKWVIDPDTGQIEPEQEPTADPRPEPRPAPVQAAPQTYD